MPVVGYYVTKDGAPCALNKGLHVLGVLVPAKRGEGYHVFSVAEERTVARSGKRAFAYIRAMRAVDRTRKCAQRAGDSMLRETPALKALLQRGEFAIVAISERAESTVAAPRKRSAADIAGELFSPHTNTPKT